MTAYTNCVFKQPTNNNLPLAHVPQTVDYFIWIKNAKGSERVSYPALHICMILLFLFVLTAHAWCWLGLASCSCPCIIHSLLPPICSLVGLVFKCLQVQRGWILGILSRLNGLRSPTFRQNYLQLIGYPSEQEVLFCGTAPSVPQVCH